MEMWHKHEFHARAKTAKNPVGFMRNIAAYFECKPSRFIYLQARLYLKFT